MKIFKDMDTDQFWMTLWTLGASLILAIVTAVGINSYHEDILIAELLKDGSDPLELACLFNASTSLEAACMIIAQGKANNVSK